ncbi:DUF2330 domain-containing protein [Massilia sp. W12]|uniref:DUF2330 domain-containing protein n=1 Tax=Massilia sp. W12 TaxID=3126507 RepID=UPI0030CFFC59
MMYARFQKICCVMLLGAAAFSQQAQAFCGFYAARADASLYNRASQVILARDGERTVISMQNDYAGPLSEFVLVVPTPQVIKQGQVRIADKAIFKKLDELSAPRLTEYHDEDPCKFEIPWGIKYMSVQKVHVTASTYFSKDARRYQATGVTVEAKFTLDEYDIVSLSAKQSEGLELWLRQNGYKIPPGASSALAPYIKQGMKFFVAKVNLKEQKRIGFGYLRPLQFAFESPKFMLPMRLGMLNAEAGKPQDLIVYALTREGRVEAANYRTSKLPTDMALPNFIKPHYAEFYQAMFDKQSKQEGYRNIFTEYAWSLNSCDPCITDPPTNEELQKAGVFWLSGDAQAGFAALQSPGGLIKMPPLKDERKRPAVITRLHLRYTPESFPEDLVLTATRDSRNWQVRHFITYPFKGDMASCKAQVEKTDCNQFCQVEVKAIMQKRNEHADANSNRAQEELHQECMQTCQKTKQRALQQGQEYYEELPKLLQEEAINLPKLSGWSAQKIDQLKRSAAGQAAAKPKSLAAP